MNTQNNKRRKASQNKIETAFVELLQEKELQKITVTDICKTAGVNRTTFYANYLDLPDLAEAVRKKLEADVFGLYEEERQQGYNSNDFLKLFRHIYQNQLFYQTYFRLGLEGQFQITQYDTKLAAEYYGNRHIGYHMEFFRSGLTAVLKKWLNDGCQETPEEINEIILTEYMPKK